jgi:hypothetical protein
VLRERVMARSSFCCFSSEEMGVVVDAMFAIVYCLVAGNIVAQVTDCVVAVFECLPRYDANSFVF